MRDIGSGGVALRALGRITLGAVALGGLTIGASPATSAETQVKILPVSDFHAPKSKPTMVGRKVANILSAGAQFNASVQSAGGAVTVAASKVRAVSSVHGKDARPKNKHDLQASDPALDHTQSFAGTWPFEFATQSESSIAADGKHVVAGYNSSAGAHVVEYDTPSGPALGFDQIFLSGYSVSHDWGRTWQSGFIAPPTGSIATYGDPVVAKDRKGSFYYASLGLDADFNFGIFVGKSTDHGDTFAPAVKVALDNGGDKEWLAVGPSPTNPDKDNVYVTWTSYRNPSPGYTQGSGPLMFSRSTDGGATWSAAAEIFAPPENPGVLYGITQFSNPVVDASNGRLYVPFLQFGWFDSDYVRVLVSDDAGATFSLLKFNVAGAPDIYAYPAVTPGTLADCGYGGIRVVYKQGPNIGGGRFGFERYNNCTRTINQPAAAAANGRLVIAMNVSTSPYVNFTYDPSVGGNIVALHSNDGGATWLAPISVAPSTTSDPNHFHPAVALGQDGKKLFVGYYVQQQDEKFRTEIASFKLGKDGATDRNVQALSSVTFDLPPSVIPVPTAGDPYDTWNWDRLISPGYSMGEYMGVTLDDEGKPMACWGESRNTWTSPSDALAPGTHTQADVFFRRVNND